MGLGSNRHLHISRNTPCLPTKHSVYSLSSISLRTTVTVRRIYRLRFSLGGAHKVYYKRCANGECCLRKAESVIVDKSPWESESITAVLCITNTVLKSSAVILKIHNPPPPPSPLNTMLKDQRNCALTVSTLSLGWERAVQVACGYKISVC